ncbi:MAG TPA: acyl-CoA dehydrogenase C-terminal domain-containing protein [Pseudomonas sp.]|nr:acyl-CoA dehydrogenase C-terminal domain-containing protein [Pseudomonas sp.]
MNNYQPPLRDIQFLLSEVFDAEMLWANFSADDNALLQVTAMAVLEEAGKLATNVLAPLNRTGDEEGAQWREGVVTTPVGFPAAFAAYAAGGWLGFSGNPEFGGLGMPKMLAVHLEEMLYSTNPAFALYTVLSCGAALAINAHATPELKQRYLPNLYSGVWTGSMCLTEPQCGTDLGLICTRAQPQSNGSYSIRGTKIFITGGDHDLTENIIHLVLARLPDAPPGSKGISLFLVPKVLPNDEGQSGTRNSLSCGSIEDKMGIKASATCVMNFDDATGWLVGEENQGLAAMFTMMNYERLTVGIQGVGCAYASYLNAVVYAQDRLQGRAPQGAVFPQKAADPIIHHPDVRRMLMAMKALTEAGRALSTYVGSQLDLTRHTDNAQLRASAQSRVALLTPLAKAFLTDTGLESCVLGQQIFGGHGYIREWAQEQWVRDVRIAQIYEGTNGIQALDLLSRKVLGDDGEALRAFLDEMRAFADHPEVVFGKELLEAVQILEDTTQWVQHRSGSEARNAGAASVEYLHLFGYVTYAYLWARMAAAATGRQAGDQEFYAGKRSTASFFFKRLLPRIHGLVGCIRGGVEGIYEMAVDQF